MKALLNIIATTLIFIGCTDKIFPQLTYGWKDFNPYELYEGSHIQFINDSIGWIMPHSNHYQLFENNALFKTIDGGKTWDCIHQLEAGVFEFPRQRPFIFTDADTGYYFYRIRNTFGWKIWKTTDGGSNWNNVYSFSGGIFKNSFFINGKVGWISDYSKLYKTTDGGTNWFKISNLQSWFESWPFFFDENKGFFLRAQVGASELYKTTDGQTWNFVADWSGLVESVSFIDELNGYITINHISLGRVLMKTTDGGVSWSNLSTLSVINPVNLVEARDSIVAAAAFDYSLNITSFYVSTNSGSSWNVMTIPGHGLYGGSAMINIINPNKIFLTLDNYVFKITDLGNSWEKVAIGPTHNLESIINVLGGKPFAVGWKENPQTMQIESAVIGYHPLWRVKSIYENKKLKCISAKNNTEIFIGGYDYSNGGKSLIYKCDNQGNNLEEKYSSIGSIINDISFVDANNGIAVGGQGTIVRTTDGGNSWAEHSSIINEELNTIKFGTQLGFIGGANGLLLRSTDSGNNWVQIPLNINKEIKSILFYSLTTIWLVGKDGLIMRSEDAGISWSQVNASSEYDFNSIVMMSPIHIGIYGRKKIDNSPLIMETHDGGNSWVFIGTPVQLESINFVYPNGSNAWAAGDKGTILYSSHWFTPVEMSSFIAVYSNGSVQLNWSTASELNNQGFEIERSTNKTDWIKIGFKEGQGTTTEQQNYSYTDDVNGINISKLYYRLKQMDYDGSYEFTDIVEVTVAPLKFSLSQNYPNPFNPSTNISWQSPVGSHQTLKVYDVLGREVATLVNEYRDAGSYEVEFDASQLASGVYYYQLRTEKFSETKKMMVVK
ncbi:MAG: T9SS type A sorting domain-containing protein [Ignavibacteriales bacterium]|nr:MAG: T9SS type A sorting domain-containing protein [Ignavibacteriales bacterium]